MRKRKPGAVPPGKIAVFDRKGQLRGHVGPRATSATAARFTKQLGAKLMTKNGQTCWGYEK